METIFAILPIIYIRRMLNFIVNISRLSAYITYRKYVCINGLYIT